MVGVGHLRESPALVLYHGHLPRAAARPQRNAGRELWPENLSYVQRPTEIEAYQFVVDEARRIKVSDPTIREYLRVEWIDDDELGELFAKLGVPCEVGSRRSEVAAPPESLKDVPT